MFDDVKHPVFEVKGLHPGAAMPEIILRSIGESKAIRLHRHGIGDSIDFIQSFSDLLQSGYRLDRPEGQQMLQQFAAAVHKITEENKFFTQVYREVIALLEKQNTHDNQHKQKERGI